jgi:hypothetical protein
MLNTSRSQVKAEAARAARGPGLPLLHGLRVVPADALTGWKVVAKKGHRQTVPLGTVHQVRLTTSLNTSANTHAPLHICNPPAQHAVQITTAAAAAASQQLQAFTRRLSNSSNPTNRKMRNSPNTETI